MVSSENGMYLPTTQLNIACLGIARTPSPAIGEHVMAVASFENAEKFGHVFHIADNDAHYGPFGKHHDPNFWTMTTAA